MSNKTLTKHKKIQAKNNIPPLLCAITSQTRWTNSSGKTGIWDITHLLEM